MALAIPRGLALDPIEEWYCPQCHLRDRVRGWHPNRFHNCARMGGMTAPLLRDGVRAKIEVREREDYVGDELVQLDANGRPVMSIVTTRDDGQDAIVFAPTARVRGAANGAAAS